MEAQPVFEFESVNEWIKLSKKFIHSPGGFGGETVYVATEKELHQAVSGDEPRIVIVTGRIELREKARVGSNKSILGSSAESGVGKSGFHIRRQKNIIIRGLQIYKTLAPNDGVSIDESTNIWIHHNDFYSDLEHGKDYYDGLLDAKRGSDYITVSFNKFRDHYKCILIGHSDNNRNQDTGKVSCRAVAP